MAGRCGGVVFSVNGTRGSGGRSASRPLFRIGVSYGRATIRTEYCVSAAAFKRVPRGAAGDEYKNSEKYADREIASQRAGPLETGFAAIILRALLIKRINVSVPEVHGSCPGFTLQ
jgi:hypothetical protein